MKNTLLFFLFIFLSFSCSNDKIIGVDYDFINPEKNEPSLENQIIEHITNSIKYNPKNVYNQKELKDYKSKVKNLYEDLIILQKKMSDTLDLKSIFGNKI